MPSMSSINALADFMQRERERILNENIMMFYGSFTSYTPGEAQPQQSNTDQELVPHQFTTFVPTYIDAHTNPDNVTNVALTFSLPTALRRALVAAESQKYSWRTGVGLGGRMYPNMSALPTIYGIYAADLFERHEAQVIGTTGWYEHEASIIYEHQLFFNPPLYAAAYTFNPEEYGKPAHLMTLLEDLSEYTSEHISEHFVTDDQFKDVGTWVRRYLDVGWSDPDVPDTLAFDIN